MDRSLQLRVRSDGLALSAFDGDLLIQDIRRHKAHALNPQAAAVFRLADGTHSIEEIVVLASAALPEPVSPVLDRSRGAVSAHGQRSSPAGGAWPGTGHPAWRRSRDLR